MTTYGSFMKGVVVAFILAASVFNGATIGQASSKTALGPSDVGRRIEFKAARCGQNSVRATAATVQVIVVGNSGRLNCIIRITERFIRASDFRAGYACVGADKAKPAFIVRKDDARVVREKGYAKQLELAEAFAQQNNLPLEIIYIRTNAGPPHFEKRCRKMLDAS